jgi:hypothetical protein
VTQERQALLAEHGLVEDRWGSLALGSLRGLQQGSRRALRLREQGHEEAARMLRLPTDDPLRLRFLEALQIEAFSVAYSNNS